MSVDITTPDSPRVYRENRDEEYVPSETRRADIQDYLDGSENAWQEGFGDWASETTISDESFLLLGTLGMFERFDFRWEPETGRVDYDAPRIPVDWQTTDRYSALDSWDTVSEINEELDDLGETVAGVLSDYYLAWETDSYVVDTFGSQFNGYEDGHDENETADEGSPTSFGG